MESVAAFEWNQWSSCRGIDGRLGLEYADQGPAIYRIRVRGRLDARLVPTGLPGCRSLKSAEPDGKAETILVGRLPDQAGSRGRLESLQLHLPVVKTECVDSEDV